MERYLLSIDQGTTGTKALLINKKTEVVQSVYQTHQQFYPDQSWVEHDPQEIWQAIQSVVGQAMKKQKIVPDQIKSVGLSNQGETSLLWYKDSLEPVYPAIVWSDNRTEGMARQWASKDDWEQKLYFKTGLNISSYFSGTKIKWVIENVSGVKEGIEDGSIRAGTLDTWLISKLTGGKSFYTDASTASRTMLYNINENDWDQEILDYLEIPRYALAKVLNTVDEFGETDPETFIGIQAPVTVGIVDQPAGLFGHLCLNEGESKVTYGTGAFVYMNVGEKPILKQGSNLLTSVIWSLDGRKHYSLDGSVYSAGSSINWGAQKGELYPSVDELQRWSVEWYRNRNYKNEVFYIPSITGLGAPFWNNTARGTFLGINAKSSKYDMAKAILEGIAHRVADVLELLENELGQKISYLNVDGKPTSNPYLMQFQANILGVPIRVNDEVETTALGIAYLQGEKAGWWNTEELKENKQKNMITYYPEMSSIEVNIVRNKWRHMVNNINKLYEI